ncbi:MAG: tetratricopeptide repeat protein [Planctomycetota bacterium]|nr:tetratricopeptide repeat protein [Planctomycetota bacterium]
MSELNVVSAVDEICAQATLSPELILKLRSVARNNLAERKVLQTRLGALDGEALSKEEKSLRTAVFAWILSRYDQAESASKELAGALAHLVKGEIALDREQYDEAASQLKQAAEQLQAPKIGVEIAAALRAGGKLDDAVGALERIEKQGLADADLLFQKGRCLEARGQQESACTCYEKALELDPNHAEAAFRLAYYLDLRGEDNRAIELYKRVTGQGPAFVSAMLNLGMLLEDKEDVDGAIAAYKEAIKVDPTNKRAALYLRDSVESLDMYYDENERKENERLEAVLRIPIADFELSVRSRNCLAKMNVRSLGDLVRKTDQELLSYKNFGETSLQEIRNLLESKGLRLGMFKEEEAKRARAQRLRTGGPENTMLVKPITDLELSVRSRKCMQRLNIETIGDLCEKSEADLLATKNFGQTSLNEVKAKLTEMGLGLKSID